MGGMKISELDFVRLLPAFMRDDEAALALSKAMNQLIGEPGKRLNSIRTWDKIEELNEAECDELAWELDVDWYDSTGMGLEEKRATLMLAQQIKRKRGTKWAVERLISAYFGEGYVMEWHELDGSVPYTFVALTTNTNITAENYVKFVEAVKAAKNERSHIAGVYYVWEYDPSIECALDSRFQQYDYKKCGTDPRNATAGISAKKSVETEPEAKLHTYDYAPAGVNTCGTYPRQLNIGATQRTETATEPETTHLLYDFPACGRNGFKATHGAAIVGTAVVGRAIVYS